MIPLQELNQLAQQVRALQNNPKEINKFLLNSGKINQEQYEMVKDMNPAQTGQFLLDNGILPKGQIDQLSQMVPQIKQLLGY